MSPSIILEGKPNPNMNNAHISFGSYVFVHIGTDNTMKRRSIPAIALNESNEHGGHYFMNLYTAKKLHSYNWQELPIDNENISRIEELVQEEKVKRLTDTYPMFKWVRGVPIIDKLLPNVNENNNEEYHNENEINDNEDIANQGENIIDHDDVIELDNNGDTRIFVSDDEGDLTDTNDNEDFDDDNTETNNDSIMSVKNDRLEIIVKEVNEDDDENNPLVIIETEEQVENIVIESIENKE